jgi:dihydroorotate dehydrogenase
MMGFATVLDFMVKFQEVRDVFRARSIRQATTKAMVGSVVIIGALEVTTHLPTQGRSSYTYHSLCDDYIVPMMRYSLNAEMAHTVALSLSWLAPTYRPSWKEQKCDVSVRLWGSDGNEQEQQKDQQPQQQQQFPKGTNNHRPAIVFHNPIGLAAGYDKDGIAIVPLLQMGFGFVEIGSVCLRSQPGNPSPRMWRLVYDAAIINRYGFNSLGADVVTQHLQDYRNQLASSTSSTSSTRPKSHPVQDNNSNNDDDDNGEPQPPFWHQLYDVLWPGRIEQLSKGRIGLNLGKNRDSATPLEDYQQLITQLGPYADYIVINVSSPNTPGLRDLQATDSLETLVLCCQEACQKLYSDKDDNDVDGDGNENNDKIPPSPPPLLVKLSPDLTDDELIDIATVLVRLNIDGIIVTNTTTSRPANLQSSDKVQLGGLSGKPLSTRSTECIRLLYRSTNGQVPIIGVGGVFTGYDAYEKFKAGASLVQVYTGMTYEGPGMVSKVRDELAAIMIQNGQRNLQQDVVGLDHDMIFWNKQRRAINQNNTGVPTMVIDELDKEGRKGIQQ